MLTPKPLGISPLLGNYNPRHVDAAVASRLTELVRLHGASVVAARLGIAPNTLRRVVLGEPVRGFVAAGLEAQAPFAA